MNIALPVAYLIQAVSAALTQVRQDTGAQLRVSQIELNIETSQELGAEGELTVAPLKIGGVYSQAETQSLTLRFEEHPQKFGNLAAIQINPDQLRSLTVAVQVAIQEGAAQLADYRLASADLTFRFGVTAEGNVTLGLGGRTQGLEFKLAGSQKTTHSLTLTVEQGAAKP